MKTSIKHYISKEVLADSNINKWQLYAILTTGQAYSETDKFHICSQIVDRITIWNFNVLIHETFYQVRIVQHYFRRVA